MAGTTQDTSSHEHFQHAPNQTALERQLNKGLSQMGQYASQILIACVVIAIVLVAIFLWRRASHSRDVAAWTAFSESRSPEDYLAIADKHSSADVGSWARLEAGKLYLQEGLSQALVNRESSDASLKKAQLAFETLLNQKTSPVESRQEALYGLATTLEALSDGDSKSALEAYESLLKEFPNSPHKLWAESRIEQLKTGDAQSFYAWFRKQNPKPADRPGPKDIPGSEAFNLDLDLPDDTSAGAPENGKQAPAAPEGAAMPDKSVTPAAEFPAEGTLTVPTEKAVTEPAQPEPAKPAPVPVPMPASDGQPGEAPASAKPTEEAQPATEVKPAAGTTPESQPAEPETTKPAEPITETAPQAEAAPETAEQ